MKAIMRTTIKRLGWMVLIWAGSVVGLGVVALFLRALVAPSASG